MKISACWIAKNEEKNIARSIDSVKNVVDEMVLVDTGSDDDTVEIARSFGVRVESFEWTGDFSAARNYALSLATGEIVIFLDADEWFVPSLTADDHERIEKYFSIDSSIDALECVCSNVDGDGTLLSTGTFNRILRKAPHLAFVGIIHERYDASGASEYNVIAAHDFNIYHSGYSKDIINHKMLRNVAALEKSLSTLTDPSDIFITHCFLMREYKILEDNENALPHLLFAISNIGMFKKYVVKFGNNFIEFFYHLIELSASLRHKICRKQVKPFTDLFTKMYPFYPGSATIDLNYRILFDYSEPYLLENLGAALKASNSMPPSTISYYRKAEETLCYIAALALFRRGRIEEAFDYAARAYGGANTPFSPDLLLSLVKGQPAQDVIAFLNGFYDHNIPDKLDMLVTATRLEGFLDVHLYYLKKQIDSGAATKGSFLFMLLLLGKHSESLESARSMYSDGDADTVGLHLFVTAICTDDKAILHTDRAMLGKYAPLLESYFDGEVSLEITGEQIDILEESYDFIALAGGLAAADRLLGMFKKAALALYFRTKSEYCMRNQRYRDILSEDTSEVIPYYSDCGTVMSYCYITTGLYEQALSVICLYLDKGMVHHDMIENLGIIAEKAPAQVAARATALYDRYSSLVDLITDMSDIVNTRVVFDKYSKKDLRLLATLTITQFDKELARDSKRTVNEEALSLAVKVGTVCEENGLYGMAQQYYRISAAHGVKEGFEMLSHVFSKLGNQKLSTKLLERARL